MPTVMLTATCPNACPWCFARPKMERYTASGITEMAWEDFLQVVDFYERSGTRHMALLGGEPTRHSRLLDVLACLESRQFSIQIGTNGVVSPSLVDVLRERRFPRLFFFLNSTSYFDYEPDKKSQVDYLLTHIGYPVKLAYTISERDVTEPSINPVLDRIGLIIRRSLVPHLQLQVAVPGAQNGSFVPLDRYETLVDLLDWWPAILRKNGFSCALDCHSIPRCNLPEEGAAPRPFPYKSTCSSFMIDIGPNLEVWPCFPLSGETYRLGEFRTFADVSQRFMELASSRQLLYEERCQDCERRVSRSCDCGCWGFQHVRGAAKTNVIRSSHHVRTRRDSETRP